MAQRANLHRIKKFVNPIRLYIIYGKSGGLHLAEPGLMAGRQAGSQAVCQMKFGRGMTFLKLAVDQNIQFPFLFNKGTALFDAFLVLFSGKHNYKVVL